LNLQNRTKAPERVIKKLPKLTNVEMQIMGVLWKDGPSTVRQVHEKMPGVARYAYTTIQTVMNRLETKKALKRKGMIGMAYLFEATIPPEPARRRLLDEFLAAFGGEAQPVVMGLIDAGKLDLEDVRQAERYLRSARKEGK
jgi:BlaI family penicillinase repressor